MATRLESPINGETPTRTHVSASAPLGDSSSVRA